MPLITLDNLHAQLSLQLRLRVAINPPHSTKQPNPLCMRQGLLLLLEWWVIKSSRRNSLNCFRGKQSGSPVLVLRRSPQWSIGKWDMLNYWPQDTNCVSYYRPEERAKLATGVAWLNFNCSGHSLSGCCGGALGVWKYSHFIGAPTEKGAFAKIKLLSVVS